MENEVKEPAPKYHYISPDEYLKMERASEMKHEYYNGYVEAMSGASLKHGRIERNLISGIAALLSGTTCELLPSTMRVSTPGRDAYLYPDVTIICGEPELEDNKFDTLLNPMVIFEILSPSTRKNDLTYKLSYYKQIKSLHEYIMIDSVKRAIQVHRKQSNGSWQAEEVPAGSKSLYIESIELYITLDDIYYLTGV